MSSVRGDLHMLCESDSESSDDYDTERSLIGVKPYQFEPYVNRDGLGAQEDEEGEEDNNNRLRSVDWCQCTMCKLMPSVRESLCCWEIEPMRRLMEQTGKSCITAHPGFQSVCLDQFVLQTAYLQYRQQYGDIITDINNRYRYTAYRQLVRFSWEILGRHVRQILPACAVDLIRRTFPSANGVYTGYLEPDSH